MNDRPGQAAPELLRDPSSGLTYRLRRAGRPGQSSFVLLHGFGGDENVLWVVESALPEGSLVVAPRGLFPAEGGGYAWVDGNLGSGESLHDFDSARWAISRWIDRLAVEHRLVASQTFLIGFSQGSALAFALAALRDLRPHGVACLAGYLPEGNLQGLEGLPVFWSHGTRDDRVPIDRARGDIQRIRDARAIVDYCESDSGHKVGVECMRALKAWLKSMLAPDMPA